MSYVVDGIPGNVTIDPERGGEQRQRKREKGRPKTAGDSVSISDEARRRSEGNGEEPPEP